MAKTIEPNPQWDSSVVRCSSTGEDAAKYHDVSQHSFESGKNIGSALPIKDARVRGVIIPRATALGGSKGFDPQKPRLVNIDPDIPGQSCVVDLSQITKEKMDEAFKEAGKNPLVQDNLLLRAAQTFHNLAIGYEPVGVGSSCDPPTSSRESPLGVSGYVVPRSTSGGAQIVEEKQAGGEFFLAPQELISPSVTPRTHTFANTSMPTIPNIDLQTIKKYGDPPSIKVLFEMDGWGQFEAHYHDIIMNDGLIILVYDTTYKSGMKWSPPTTDKIISLTFGNNDTIYAYSYGNKFAHLNYEYNILVVEE